MSLVLYSDPHFASRSSFGRVLTDPEFHGTNSRFHYIAETFRAAVQHAEDIGAERLVVLGDVFHERGIVQVPVFNAVKQLLEEAALRINVILFPGNHDVVDMRALHIDKNLHSLYGLNNVAKVVSKPYFCETDNFGIAIIPFIPSADRTIKVSKILEQKLRKVRSKPKLLLLHHAVDGAVAGPWEYQMEGIKLNASDLPGFSGIFSGHFHKHQRVGSLVYVGAPIQHDRGERNYKPGFIVVQNDGSWEHIENKISPRFKVIEASDLSQVPKESSNYCTVRWVGEDDPEVQKIIRLKNPTAVIDVKKKAKTARTSIKLTDTREEVMAKYVKAKIGDENEAYLRVGYSLL